MPATSLVPLETQAHLPLEEVWGQLTRGEMRILEPANGDLQRPSPRAPEDGHVLLVQRCHGRPPKHPAALLHFLLGQQAKNIAADLSVAVSTVSHRQSKCLEAMGFSGRLLQVPTLLVLAAHAASGSSRLPSASVETLPGAGSNVVLLRAPPIDHALDRLLPPREAAVTRLLIRGYSHAQIAATFGTSTSTITNQLASVYSRRHFGASGRFALIAKLLET